MNLAYISFRQILTLLILAAVGLICAKICLIDDATNKKLSNLLLLLVNPLVIVLSYQRPFEQELLLGLLLAVVLGAVSFAIAAVVSHIVYRIRGSKDYAVEKFAAVYPNSAFLGIPLINGIFGTEGVFYLTGYLTVFFAFFWTHGMIVMSGKKDFSAIKKAMVSPPMLSIFVGFALFMMQIELPEVVATPIELLGSLNTPLAMLVAGASIYGAKVGRMLKDRRIYGLCAMRLLILPGLTMLVFAPFNIPPMVLGTVIVASACPVAISLILFAHRYNKDHVYASQAFAASTVLSMGTIPLLLLFL